MVLDMLPVLNGEKNKLEFEFSKVLEKDSIICETFSDVDFFEPISVRGYVKNMAGYMYLHCDVSFKYSTACARCAEPVTNELAFSFEKDIASGDVSRDNDDYIFIEDVQKIIEYFIDFKPLFNIINLTPTDSISLLDIAKIVNNKGLDIIIDKEGLNFEYTGDNTRLLNSIPDFKFTDINEGLGKLYKYIQGGFDEK